MEKIKKLEFEKNDNNKFLCLSFISVVPPLSFFEAGEKFQIRIAEKHFCFAEVLMKKELEFQRLIELGYNYLDAGLGEKAYYDYLCDRFGKRKWWNGKDTRFTIVFFKKVVQLNLFEDNEELVP